jgi:BolA protein
MTYYDRIVAKLNAALAPDRLEVVDESHLHADHNIEAATSGETHFRVTVVSAALAGLSRVERHRRINALLADELAERVHALAIDARAP